MPRPENPDGAARRERAEKLNAQVDLYDVARQVTDEVLGAGTYDEMNRRNPDPGVQAAIARGRLRAAERVELVCRTCEQSVTVGEPGDDHSISYVWNTPTGRGPFPYVALHNPT